MKLMKLLRKFWRRKMPEEEKDVRDHAISAVEKKVDQLIEGKEQPKELSIIEEPKEL